MQVITAEQIKEAIREVLSEEQIISITQEEYLSRQEVCKRLKISLPTLDKWSKEGVIKGKCGTGRKIKYKWSVVEQSLSQSKGI